MKEKRPVVLGVQEALVHQKDDLATAFPVYGVVRGGTDDGDRGGELNCIFYEVIDGGAGGPKDSECSLEESQKVRA